MTDPIRIFIGTSANDEDLEFMATAHYTLEKHASRPLDITWMCLSRDPASFWFSDPKSKRGWQTQGWATPFSALRWGIPAACNFEGKAIYMDLDKLVMADIAELWDTPFNGKPMVSKPEAICVSMYDNVAMKKMLPPLDQIKSAGFYREVRRLFSQPHLIQRYKGNWNCLDMRRDDGTEYPSIDDPDIKLIHFTAIPWQPHLKYALPRCKAEGIPHWYTKQPPVPHPRKDAVALYDRTLEEALAHGYALDNYRNPDKFGDYGR